MCAEDPAKDSGFASWLQQRAGLHWSASIDAQGQVLDRLIRAELGPTDRTVLDCACGIGTQAIGLAGRGHRVVGSDLRPVATRRAAVEAAARDLVVPTAAADMRHLPFADGSVDVIVCADNAIAHPGGPVISFQLLDWHPDGRHHDPRHIQLKPDADTYVVRVRRATSWGLTRAELTDAVHSAGYHSITWHDPEDSGFGQPVLACRSS